MDLDALQDEIVDVASSKGTKVLQASGGDLKDTPVTDIKIKDACSQMKWIHDNSGFRFKPYFELDYENPRQGIRVYNDAGKVVKHFQIPVTGGDDGDPTKQISINMYAMIYKATQYVAKKLQN